MLFDLPASEATMAAVNAADLYSHVEHRFIAQPIFCRPPHHPSADEALPEEEKEKFIISSI